MSLTKACACLGGSAPTVSERPNSGGSWVAAGITKVRVSDLVKPGPVKSVSSQRVAATFSLAFVGSVPTQGWSMVGTGGRSTSIRSEGCSPTGTGADSLSFGAAAQLPASGKVQSPETAVASSPALGRGPAPCSGR